MTLSKTFLSFSIVCLFLFSCGEKTDKPAADSALAAHSRIDSSANPVFANSQNIEAKTFEVTDSTGKPKGWGYDLYVDGKRSIHQPIIPAVAGNDAFASETDAKKAGDLAASKMKVTGSLPTISIHDLDSLGIRHK